MSKSSKGRTPPKIRCGGILGLDIAGTTGWAYRALTGRRPPISGEFTAGWENCHDTQFFKSFDNWIDRRLVLFDPSCVVLEAPLLLPHDKLATLRRIYGSFGIVEAAAARRGLVDNVFELGNQEIKKHATGDHRATKDDMMDAARAKRWEFIGDDACDALWIVDCFMAKTSSERGK